MTTYCEFGNHNIILPLTFQNPADYDKIKLGDLKRGVDADKLMAKLFKATPLEDSFS